MKSRRGRVTRYKATVFDGEGTLYWLRPLQRAVQIHLLRGYWYGPREAWKMHRVLSEYRRATDLLREGSRQ